MPICEDVQTSLPNPTPGPPALPSFVQIKIGIFHNDNFGVDVDGDDIEVDEEEKDDLGHVDDQDAKIATAILV